MDPVKITIFSLPGLLLLWLLTLAAFGVFGYRIWQLIGLLRQGRYEDRFDHLGQRIVHGIKHVLLQPRIFNERGIGLPHFLIFWGFIIYATCFNWALVRGLFPFLTPEGRKGIGNAFKYYLFLRREPPEVIGHNALAGMTYAGIVVLYFLQTVTGFALLGEVNPAGIWHPLTGWIFRFVTNQDLRLVHHLIMWLLIAFAVHHVYAAILIDNEEGNGLMSSIFSGFKFIHANLLKKVNGVK